MVNMVSGYNPYSTYGAYGVSYASRANQAQAPDQVRAAQRTGVVMAGQKAHQPDTPVQPVAPVRSVSSQEDPAQAGLLRFGSDPAEMAVRMRIQYPESAAQQGSAAQAAEAGQAQAMGLPGGKGGAAQQGGAAEAANAGRAQAPAAGLKGEAAGQAASPALEESKSAQEVMEEGECQTCKERKYQDGSDDPGVSFKTPTNISPEQAASAVRGHENEHVVREQAKAQQEDRKVVSQSVTYHSDICPECGKVYVSGGETRTVTKADSSQQAEQQAQQQASQQDPRKPFAAVA